MCQSGNRILSRVISSTWLATVSLCGRACGRLATRRQIQSNRRTPHGCVTFPHGSLGALTAWRGSGKLAARLGQLCRGSSLRWRESERERERGERERANRIASSSGLNNVLDWSVSLSSCGSFSMAQYLNMSPSSVLVCKFAVCDRRLLTGRRAKPS